MSRISIALCTYNGEKFLSEQLESFLRQTHLPDELVVCDDGSTDKTIEILNRFETEAPFAVSIYRNEKNLGTVKNFERAISLCAGDIIFLSDQDDVWLPEKIKTVKAEFDKSAEVGMVFTNALIVDENLKSLREKLWDYTFQRTARRKFRHEAGAFEILANGMTATGATMAFRSELKNLVLPIPPQKGFIHDGWIAFAAYAFYEIIALDCALVRYRQHGSQQVGVRKSKDYLPEDGREPAARSRRERYQEAMKRETEKRERIESLKCNYENAVLCAARSDSRFERAARNPIPHLDRIARGISDDIEHLAHRRDLPSARLSRIPGILAELIGGKYHKFSRGARSALLDFVERG